MGPLEDKDQFILHNTVSAGDMETQGARAGDMETQGARASAAMVLT